MIRAKPRLCIAFPGNNCRKNTTFAVEVSNLVRHLEKTFAVTLVFRTIREPLNLDCRQLAVLDCVADGVEEVDFFTPNDFAAVDRCMENLDRFAKSRSTEFDYVIEKTWRLDGALTHCFAKYGTPGAPILEGEFHLSKINGKSFPRSRWQQMLWPIFRSRLIANKKKWLRVADTIITETRQMRSWLVQNDYIKADAQWLPLPAAYDRDIFYPRDREACRAELGLDQSAFILAYLGSLNCLIHDPYPFLEAAANQGGRNLLICMIGDGSRRQELEAFCDRLGIAVVFTGRVGQTEASKFIGAANLCMAPYNVEFYPGRQFTSGSLKVVEYLACGRPVVSIPCGRMSDLLEGGKYGFLVENTVQAYRDLFRALVPASLFDKEQELLRDVRNGRLAESGYALDFSVIVERLTEMVTLRMLRDQRKVAD